MRGRIFAVADVFDALAAPVRRAILDVLVERDDQTLFELCGRLASDHHVGLTRQAISQHLAVLEAAGLVHTRRDGRYKFHSIDTAPLRAAMAAARPDLGFIRIGAAEFAGAPEDSIDYAIMEKSDAVSTVPLDCGWSDLGAWDAVWREMEADGGGLVTAGDVTATAR